MRAEFVQHLDLEGKTEYHTLSTNEGYVGTFSSRDDLGKAIRELGNVSWTLESWSVLRGSTSFGYEDIW